MKLTGNVQRISRPFIPFEPRVFRTGVNAAIREMEKVAIELTSGTATAEDLKRAGHPFSRRRPRSFPRLPINKRSGGIQQNIRIVRRVVGGVEQLYLQINHPHAAILAKEGTATQVPRGFQEAFAKRTQGILKYHVQRAFRRK